MGAGHKVPGAHAETEEIPTGRGASGGVTKLKEAHRATPSDDSDEWAKRSDDNLKVTRESRAQEDAFPAACLFYGRGPRVPRQPAALRTGSFADAQDDR